MQIVWKVLNGIKAFSVSHSAPPPSRVYTRSCERTPTGQLTSTEQRDISHHMMSSSKVKSGRKEKNGILIKLQHMSSQLTITCDGVLFSWRWPNTFQLTGISGLIPYVALLLCAALAVKLFYSQFTNFSLLSFPLSSWFSLGQSEWVVEWSSATSWG